MCAAAHLGIRRGNEPPLRGMQALQEQHARQAAQLQEALTRLHARGELLEPGAAAEGRMDKPGILAP